MAEKDKIADEVLSEEELDQVVGGDIATTALDSHLLYDYGLISDWHSSFNVMTNWKEYSSEVDSGWAKVGITCVTTPVHKKPNGYYAGDRKIGRDEAVKILKSKFYRKHYTYSDDDGIGNP